MFRKEYKVTVLGRAGLKYCDGSRTMTVDSEMLVGDEYDMVVYVDSIRAWDPPHETEDISQVIREQIRQNIKESLKNLRIEWD